MKRWLALLLSVCMLFCVAGCGKPTDDPSDDDKKPSWEPEAPETIDLTALLTHEDVSAVIPTVTFGDGMLQEHDSVWLFTSADYTTQIWLMVEEPAIDAIEYLDTIPGRYAADAITKAPNLGAGAYWCGESGELWVAAEKHVICIGVACTTLDAESRLIHARSLALKVLGRL